tara:strand:- start:85 stop:348 length:264 start_codon:yes stop_codon:yes gene_type:complete
MTVKLLNQVGPSPARPISRFYLKGYPGFWGGCWPDLVFLQSWNVDENFFRQTRHFQEHVTFFAEGLAVWKYSEPLHNPENPQNPKMT